MDQSANNLKPHTATQFDDDLDLMCKLVMEMGGMVEKRVITAMAALSESNAAQAKGIVKSDYMVNELEVEIDGECTRILALHQPVARDLRLVTTTLKMIADLERIGDEARKIAKQVSIIDQGGVPEDILQNIQPVSDEVIEMVHIALDGFARQEDKLSTLKQRDRLVDEKCQNAMNLTLSEMPHHPDNIKQLLSIIWCIRSLERIGDHAKNIGEYTSYMLGGEDVRYRAKTRKENQAT